MELTHHCLNSTAVICFRGHIFTLNCICMTLLYNSSGFGLFNIMLGPLSDIYLIFDNISAIYTNKQKTKTKNKKKKQKKQQQQKKK